MWSVQREAWALAAASRGAGVTHVGSCIHSALGTPPNRLHRENGPGSAQGPGRGKVSAWAPPSAHYPLTEALAPRESAALVCISWPLYGALGTKSSGQQKWPEGCTEVVDRGRKEWEVQRPVHF